MNQCIFVGILQAPPVLIPETNMGTFVLKVKHVVETTEDILFYINKEMFEKLPLQNNITIGVKAHVKNNNNNLELHAEKITDINIGK